MDFREALQHAKKHTEEMVPNYLQPDCEADPDDPLEFIRSKVLILNSQRYYDGREFMKFSPVVQTPAFEGICFKDMRDLMCSNAEKYGYFYTAVSVYDKQDSKGRSISCFEKESNHDGVNLTVSYEFVSGTVIARHNSRNTDFEGNYRSILSELNIKVDKGQQIFWVFFSETSLPLERPEKRFTSLGRDNSFFGNLLSSKKRRKEDSQLDIARKHQYTEHATYAQ